MSELYYLARAGVIDEAISFIGFLAFRLLVVSLTIFLAGQVFAHMPYLTRFLQLPAGRLVYSLLILALSATLVWNIPSLRILHEMDLIRKAALFAWPDIIFSSLVLHRLSFLWPDIFGWINRQTG